MAAKCWRPFLFSVAWFLHFDWRYRSDGEFELTVVKRKAYVVSAHSGREQILRLDT
jgi:hypothetical protein